MRIVLDLQVFQQYGMQHPVGRHACRFAQALVRAGGGHHITLLLNDTSPDSVEELRAKFVGLLPAEHIVIVRAPSPVGHWEEQVAAQLREALLDSLQPDVVHVVLPFDSKHNTVLIPPLLSSPAVIASIAIPVAPPVVLQGDSAAVASWQTLVSLQALKRADLILCQERDVILLQEQLQIPHERLLPRDIFDPDTVTAQVLGQAADIVLQAWQKLRQSCCRLYQSCNSRRPSLAFISPLPPAQSGISDYSAELLPELARYYEITLISDQVEISPPWLISAFPVRSVTWFEEHGSGFDRILYHVGNSHFHSHMFGLLQLHPGTIVLHDVFLGGIINGLGHAIGDPDVLLRAAYRDHGYAPLQEEQRNGREAVVDRYPCSLETISKASGVLLHSRFACDCLLEHYGPAIGPRLRQIPFMRLPPVLSGRAEARARLGIPPDAFLVCSFGFLGPIKLSHRLLEVWHESPLSHDPRNCLHFIGKNHVGSYGDTMLQMIQAGDNPDSITITGFVPPETYRDYLAAADVAVQLREKSRGETSAAVYDCLAAGLPLICNAHGSSSELPDECVIMLAGSFENHHLQQAVELIQLTPSVGHERAAQAKAWLHRQSHPAQVGLCYWHAIEKFAVMFPAGQKQRILSRLSVALYPEQLTKLTENLTANRPDCGMRQLLLDISAVARHDLKTGIERVVRSIMHELLQNPPAGYRVEPVCLNEQGGYNYARSFTLRTLGLDEGLLEDLPVEVGSGDHFLGADLLLADLPKVAGCLQQWHMHNVQISFIVYDLLPIQRPDCFPPHIEPAFRAWLKIVSTVADNLICISGAVADELKEHFRYQPPQRRLPLQVGHFHLGADIGASLPTTGLLPDTEQLLQAISAAPAVLMVSTIEPRKGHTQALDAFELLWRQGVMVNLVIVGKPGWMTETLIERLDSHPEQGRRLFCLYSISDQMLELVYKNCACLLSASEGEGFGLPLIEAAQHSLPLIVRDIPVFREVAGEYASYFRGTKANDLADAVTAWLGLPPEQRPASTNLPWLIWKQSVQQLLKVLFPG